MFLRKEDEEGTKSMKESKNEEKGTRKFIGIYIKV
jgi:hypothetical protein